MKIGKETVSIKYLKQIGTSEKSINEFKSWNNKKKPKIKAKSKKCKNPTDSKLVKPKSNEFIFSYGEDKIATYLDETGIWYKREKSFKGLLSKKRGLLRFDFWVPSCNLLIEYDGAHHFVKMNSNYESQKDNDSRKDKWCKSKGIELMRIPYTEFDNIEDILSSYFEKH